MEPEARLLRVAERQYPVFDRSQAIDAGMTARQIDRRVDSGRWSRRHRGVYLPAGVTVGSEQRIMGACLACGPKAVASHGSAATVWGVGTEPDKPHVTVPAATVRRHPGIDVHRSHEIEVVMYRNFRVTPPMRTLVDVAGTETEETLERWLDEFHRRDLIDLERFARYLSRARNCAQPGTDVLRHMLGERDPARAIGSDHETIMFRLLRRSGLPMPTTQLPVRTRNGMRFIDFAYPDHRVAIEIDGYEKHGNRVAFESDRVRQNLLEELGWHVYRFTWTQVTCDPVYVSLGVGTALGLQPARWRPVPTARAKG
jgi:very-short-patch-repair endonuclease